MGNKTASRALIVVILGALLLMIVMGISGCSKFKASVAGYVYLHDKPQPNWQVQLYDESGNMVASQHTNNQGHFIISDVPPGDYTVYVLTFAGIPFKGYEEHIKVRPGRTEIFDVELGGGPLPEPPKLK